MKVTFDDKFLKAGHFQNPDGTYRTQVVTINPGARVHKFKDGKSQVVISFKEIPEKELGLNKTNCKSIIKITGSDDSDDWAGHKVEIWINEGVEFDGETVAAIRIRPAPKTAGGKGNPKPPVDEAPDFGAPQTPSPDQVTSKQDAYRVWVATRGQSPATATAFVEAFRAIGKAEAQCTVNDWRTLAEAANARRSETKAAPPAMTLGGWHLRSNDIEVPF